MSTARGHTRGAACIGKNVAVPVNHCGEIENINTALDTSQAGEGTKSRAVASDATRGYDATVVVSPPGSARVSVRSRLNTPTCDRFVW